MTWRRVQVQPVHPAVPDRPPRDLRLVVPRGLHRRGLRQRYLGLQPRELQVRRGLRQPERHYLRQELPPPERPVHVRDDMRDVPCREPRVWVVLSERHVRVGHDGVAVRGGLPFNCQGTYSTKSCDPAPAPTSPMTPSPDLPPRVDCPKGSMVLLQYNCADQSCQGCDTGPAAQCTEPHCTLYYGARGMRRNECSCPCLCGQPVVGIRLHPSPHGDGA